MENNDNIKQTDRADGHKQESKAVSVLKRIFVHNIGWKALALVTAAVMWFLAAGLR